MRMVGVFACDNVTVCSQFVEQWGRRKGLKPSDMGCRQWGAGCSINTSIAAAVQTPERYYHSTRFLHDMSIWAYSVWTDVITDRLPNALIGANFSPNHNAGSPVYQYIRSFRAGALTLPWGARSSHSQVSTLCPRSDTEVCRRGLAVAAAGGFASDHLLTLPTVRGRAA